MESNESLGLLTGPAKRAKPTEIDLSHASLLCVSVKHVYEHRVCTN